MPTNRPFAYNTGSPISGCEQVGDIAIGKPIGGYASTGLDWWGGPDEDLGYVIAYSLPTASHPTPDPNNPYSHIGFVRSEYLTDASFIAKAEEVSQHTQTFTSGIQAKTWLNTNGYWTNYISPVLSLDAGNALSYPGSGTIWTDLVESRTFNLINGPSYDSGNGGSLSFNSSSAQYAQCNSSLPSLSNWTVAIWHYYTDTNIGSGMCLVTEVYPGDNGKINYSIGDNYSGILSTGFFDGAWRVSQGWILTPNTWNFIVGTYDGNSIKMYVNDTLAGDQPFVGTSISSNGGIRLMRRWDNPDYWGGKLATIDIYDKALNATQVSEKWNLTKSRFGL